MPKKNMTNIAFLIDLMEYSRHGALMQALVIDGLTKHANRVAASKPEDYPADCMINPAAWISCAKELKDALDKQYSGGKDEQPEPVSTDKYIATFKPQAWVHDYAVDVDLQGENTYDVSPEMLAMTKAARAISCKTSHVNDDLKAAAAAPEWVKEHQGPFEITVEKQDAD